MTERAYLAKVRYPSTLLRSVLAQPRPRAVIRELFTTAYRVPGERESNRGFAGRRPMTSVAPRDEKLVFGISGGSLATIGSPSRWMCWSISWHSTKVKA